jgi:hypothetical protein
MTQHTAIYNTHPTVTTIDDGVGCCDVDGNAVTINQTLVEIEITRLQAEYTSLQYQRDRAESYASIPDQLDYIYHHGVDAWKENMILPIKNKYPKEIS